MADESTTHEDLGSVLEGTPEGPDQSTTESSDGSETESQRPQDGTSSDTESSASEETSEGSSGESLPPELEERWKKLQAGHTKKRQIEVAELKTMREQMSKFQEKAEAFDKIQQSPRFKALLGDEQPAQEEEQYYSIPDDATPETKAFYKDLNERLRQAEERGSKRALNEMQEMVRPLYRGEAQRMVSEFFSKNPEASKYRQRMSELSKDNGKLTLEQLYILAASEDGGTTQPNAPAQPDQSTGSGTGKNESDKMFDEIAGAPTGELHI